MTSPGRSHSLPGLEANILRVGSIVRERLSLEVWQTLLRFSNIARAKPGDLPRRGACRPINAGIVTLASHERAHRREHDAELRLAFPGYGPPPGAGFNLAELLLALFGETRSEEEETGRLFFLLNVADSTITFRQRYLFAPILSLVLDLLMVDETNPRGIGYQLHAISEHLKALPQASKHAAHNEEQRLILELSTRVSLAKAASLEHANEDGKRPELQELLTHLISGLPKLSEAITRRYFNLTEDEFRRVYTRFGSGS